MADKIQGSDIVDQSVEVDLGKVDKILDSLFDKFVKVAGGAKELNTALRNAGSTSEVTKAVNGYRESLTELEKIKKQLVTANEKLIASQTLEAQLLAELKARQVEENKTTREFIRDKKMQEGSIDQLNAKLVQMKRAYTELAAAERDTAKGKEMLVHIQGVRTEVGKLEATMGMYHKNVGNYTNATFQMTQVLREVPNFAQSAEIGIRSLSNNIPMLIDAFMQVKKEVGSTMGALKVFGTSMMSIAGIVPIVLTVLIAYSDEIIKFVKGTDSADKIVKDFNNSLEGMLQNLKDINDEIEYNNKRIDTQTRLLIANAKARGDDDEVRRLTTEAEKKGIQEKIALLEREMTAAHEVKRMYEDRLRIKNVNSSAIPESKEDLQKAIDEAEKLWLSLGDNVASLRVDLQIANIPEFKKPKKEKETNRISDIKKQYEEEKALLDTQLKLREISEEKYYDNLAILANRYIGNRKGLNKNELHEQKMFNAELVDVAFDANEEILKILAKEVENVADQDDAKLKSFLKFTKEKQEALEKKRKLNEQYAKDEHDLITGNIEAMQRYWDKYDKEQAEKQQERLTAIADITQASIGSMSIINETIDKQNEERFSVQEEQMNAYYDAEEERIKQSGKSQAEQQELLMKLAAQKEAQQKKIDNERAQAQRKSAQRQKAIDMAQIIANTALAVTAALTDKTLGPIGRAAAAVAAGITGAAQLAAVALTPLPQYKEGIGIGNGEHKGGLAIVGDGGEHELIVEPGGKSYISPDKSTIMNLPKKTKVIPQHKLLQMVQDATHVSLANTNQPITESSYMQEMISQYEKLTSEVKDLKEVMANKKMQTNIYSDYDHNLHVQKNRF